MIGCWVPVFRNNDVYELRVLYRANRRHLFSRTKLPLATGSIIRSETKKFYIRNNMTKCLIISRSEIDLFHRQFLPKMKLIYMTTDVKV